jgi:hypothetical protein
MLWPAKPSEGKAVNEYKIYLMGPDGHVRKALPITCGDDSEAIDQARLFANKNSIEVWQAARKVATLSDESNRSGS